MFISKKDIKLIAKELYEAEKNAKPIEKSITDRYPDMTLQDAYSIQLELIDLKQQNGEVIIGKKIGFTSEKLRKQFNVTEPDYGILTNAGTFMENTPISMSTLIEPRIEGEIAFVLKEDLKGPNVTIVDVYNATKGIIPCIEVVDSRMKNWNMKLLDSISDNASNAKIVLGTKMESLDKFDLKHMGLVVTKNGYVMETAAGAAVFGHPAYSVAWLANKLSEFGIYLKKGEIILSGSFTPVFDVKANDYVEATFDGLGSVSVRFVD